jgi:hypothetical protein
MAIKQYQRPAKLYRYSEWQWLERSLSLGEFRLRPPLEDMQDGPRRSAPIAPFAVGATSGAAAVSYLTLSLAQSWDDALFDQFTGSDCCLVVHDVEQFGERIHRAAARFLPSWAGIDAAVSYGGASPLGAAFSKAKRHAPEQEWLFAWRPTQPAMAVNPVVIRIGSIEDIAQLRVRSGVLAAARI